MQPDLQRPAILYVDDEASNLEAFRRWVDRDCRVMTASSGPEALRLLEREEVGVLVSDHRMTPMTGVELLSQAQKRWPSIRRILLTAYCDRELLLAAIQKGQVHDYVLKPWDGEDLRLRLERALRDFERDLEQERAAARASRLEQELGARGGYGRLVGLEGGLRDIAGVIDRVAPTTSTVIIRGETGTGKELVAREIHRRSGRARRPFIRTNCAALSETLLESELFGHECGSFTGATRTRIGRFEEAHGGTLFLDEIGDVSRNTQVKLLRVLQEREFERVGGNKTIHVDIRLVTATHRNLEARVRAGRFRKDLYHRLNVVPIRLPPLRERPEDVEALVEHFLAEFCTEAGKQLTVTPEAVAQLRRYDWPGNIRELRNVLERAAVLADPDEVLDEDDFLFDFWGAEAAGLAHPRTVFRSESESVYDQIAQEEAAKIREALRQAVGSKARAARILGIPRTTLNDRIRRLGIR